MNLLRGGEGDLRRFRFASFRNLSDLPVEGNPAGDELLLVLLLVLALVYNSLVLFALFPNRRGDGSGAMTDLLEVIVAELMLVLVLSRPINPIFLSRFEEGRLLLPKFLLLELEMEMGR